MKYTTITVIYNPNSTGSSEQLAKAFKTDILSKIPEQKVELIATQHAGHAEELAYNAAKETESPLIISSSGDGGYNEVINGALKAQAEGAHPTTGLLPAGNANDHYNDLHSENIVEIIVNKEPIKIDVLKLTGISNGNTIERSSHSYIGFGLTPAVGKELTKSKLNAFNEAWIVIKGMFSTEPVELKIDSKIRSYDSIIFSNVDHMSKVLTVSQPSQINDGRFEVTIFPKRSRLKLLLTLLKASLAEVKEDMQVAEFRLETTNKATLVQFDGEVIALDARSKVVISINRQALHCII